MSQHAAELCTLVVNDVYGGLSSRVFGLLLRLGRLSLSAIAQHVHLPLRQLKNGLAVLIQQHLVLHATSPADLTTFYEADWDAALALMRAGKVVKTVEDRFGPAAADVTSNLLLQGHATVGDLTAAYSKVFRASKRRATASTEDRTKIRDLATRPAVAPTELQQIISRLLDVGYVKRVREEQFRPLADNYNEAERRVKRALGGNLPIGPKGKAELETKIWSLLRTWHDGGAGDGGVNGHSHGSKRPREPTDDGPSAKRSKIGFEGQNGVNGNMRDNHGASSLRALDRDMTVRVDPEMFVVAFRNQDLVDMAKRRVGTTTSLVYAEALRRIEGRISRSRDHLRSRADHNAFDLASGPSITTVQLLDDFPDEINLSSGIGPTPTGHANRPKGRQKVPRVGGKEVANIGSASEDEDLDGLRPNGDDGMEHGLTAETTCDSDDDGAGQTQLIGSTAINGEAKHRLMQLRQHLILLSEEPHRLIVQVGPRGRGEWAVDFRSLVTRLRQSELENIIAERFSKIAVRLVRILHDKGKLDEKQLSNLALVKQKEIRVTLSALHSKGFLELQEVPRDNSRAPSRTIFLWFFHPERCQQLVLEDLYQTMARLLQRSAVEKAHLGDLIAKAERSDVKGHETLYLTEPERTALQQWREKEERLLVQVARLDRLVAIFRDY